MAVGENVELTKYEVLKEELMTMIKKELHTSNIMLNDSISKQNVMMEKDCISLRQDVFKLSQQIDVILNRLNEVQKSMNRLLNDNSELFALIKSVDVQQPIKNRQHIFYANMVDSFNPLGFKKTNLKSDGTGCAFRIDMENERDGSYSFVEDECVQQEVLMAFNPIVSDSSTYDYIPVNPSRIIMVERGVVEEEGDLLVIKKKMVIKFE